MKYTVLPLISVIVFDIFSES